MLEELKKLQEELHEAKLEAFEKYEELYNNYCEKILEFLPYKGKLIKVQDDCIYINPTYINVREIFRSGSKIIIRGYGFNSEFTEYADATWVDWDFNCSHEFYIDSIDREVEAISIINDIEFNSAFDKMINNMRYKHMQKML